MQQTVTIFGMDNWKNKICSFYLLLHINMLGEETWFVYFLCIALKWEIRLILTFHSLKTTLNRPKTSKMYIWLEIIRETYKRTCIIIIICEHKTCRRTNAHSRSSMLIFIPQALILFCMSASPGTLTENPSMCASVCVRSWRSENNATPKGSHLSPFLPSSPIPPLESVPAGISFFSSEEMSDLFHHPSHKDWTLPSIHRTSVKLHILASCLCVQMMMMMTEPRKAGNNQMSKPSKQSLSSSF